MSDFRRLISPGFSCRWALAALLGLCGAGASAAAAPDSVYRAQGVASWYGPAFDGKPTASGEVFDAQALTAAHRTLPIPSYVRVRNTRNGREVIVRVNDRGPFIQGRLIDLSRAAAAQLGIRDGLGRVELTQLTPEDLLAMQLPPAASAPINESASALAAAPVNAALPSGSPPPVSASAPVDAASAAQRLDLLATATPAAPSAQRLPQGRPPVPVAAARTRAAAGHWLQLGAFGQFDAAAALRRHAAEAVSGLAPWLAVMKEGGVHNVLAGPYASRRLADEAAQAIANLLAIEPHRLRRH